MKEKHRIKLEEELMWLQREAHEVSAPLTLITDVYHRSNYHREERRSVDYITKMRKLAKALEIAADEGIEYFIGHYKRLQRDKVSRIFDIKKELSDK